MHILKCLFTPKKKSQVTEYLQVCKPGFSYMKFYDAVTTSIYQSVCEKKATWEEVFFIC